MMKRLLTLIALTALPITSFAADWTDDWFDQSTSSAPSAHSGNDRSYFSAGSFSGRYQLKNDTLITATTPKISAGCGGIEMVAGGLTYLDPEYIVEKFERIIQAAPAFAFDLALTNYCRPCADAMEKLEAVSSTLNDMQLNECAAAKKTAAYVVETVHGAFAGEAKAEPAQRAALDRGQAKNAQDNQERIQSNNGAPVVAGTEMMLGCPTKFRDIFTDGSVIENAARMAGAEGYAPIMRGLIGDAYVSYNDDQQLFETDFVEKCPGNDDASGIDFVSGTFDVRNSATAQCTSGAMSGAKKLVTDQLTAIGGKMINPDGQPLSADEINFLNRSPLPLFNILRSAIMTNTLEAQIEQLSEPLALAYANRMMTDLQEVLAFVISKANEVSADLSQSTDPSATCEPKLVIEAITAMRKMRKDVNALRTLARNDLAAKMAELNANIAYTQQVLESRRRKLAMELYGE